ncbi:MAG: TlpA disulfide reductase family protein [Pyrinomonadaceae bacterium]
MRKLICAFGISLLTVCFALGQNEQSPIVEKEINYKNWTYKNVQTGADVSLRDFTKGKKLLMVVYFAPWCPNWRHDAPMLQRLYDKYKANGLGIIGIGEYDPIASMKTNLDTLKITFPAVYESENRTEREKTSHYDYRRSTGDGRGWGSPWYIFLLPSQMEKKGDILTKKTFVINGEMIEAEGEMFIRKQLGLPAIENKSAAVSDKIEVCTPDLKTAELKKP